MKRSVHLSRTWLLGLLTAPSMRDVEPRNVWARRLRRVKNDAAIFQARNAFRFPLAPRQGNLWVLGER
jgi:hypothetical protein